MPYSRNISRTTVRQFVRIEDRLLRVGDRVYIPDVLSDGIILYITQYYVILNVLDGGVPIRRTPRRLTCAQTTESEDDDTSDSENIPIPTITEDERLESITRLVTTVRMEHTITYESDDDENLVREALIRRTNRRRRMIALQRDRLWRATMDFHAQNRRNAERESTHSEMESSSSEQTIRSLDSNDTNNFAEERFQEDDSEEWETSEEEEEEKQTDWTEDFRIVALESDRLARVCESDRRARGLEQTEEKGEDGE